MWRSTTPSNTNLPFSFMFWISDPVSDSQENLLTELRPIGGARLTRKSVTKSCRRKMDMFCEGPFWHGERAASGRRWNVFLRTLAPANHAETKVESFFLRTSGPSFLSTFNVINYNETRDTTTISPRRGAQLLARNEAVASTFALATPSCGLHWPFSSSSVADRQRRWKKGVLTELRLIGGAR